MTETFKRRLVGLLLIVVLLLIGSLILPGPGESPPENNAIQRVTLDLQALPIETNTASPVSSPLPSVIAADKPPQPLAKDKVVAESGPAIEEPQILEATPETTSRVLASPAVQAVAKPLVALIYPPKTIATKPSKASGKAGAKSQWFVQLGAFSDVENAHEQLEKYRTQKYPGLISPLDTRKGPLYRVRIGPYVTNELAEDARKRLSKAGATGTALVEE
jgi:DedD protein